MDNKKLGATSKYSGKEKAEQGSAVAKGTGARRRADMKMVQNVLLIWLDKNIDDNNQDCRNTVTQLRRIVNDINKFTDGDQCIQFINTITDNKACMVISGSLGQHIVPRVHNMSQVDSIFIFCGNKKHHEQWAEKWSKVKGVFTEIRPICDALKQASQQCEQNAISISFVSTGGDDANKNLDRLDPMFMYTQIMKEILLTIKFQQRHFKEFIEYCRDVFNDNEEELINVNKFEQKYRDKTPIWWYTCESFLFPMLNRALRMTNVDVIIKMGFFIGVLHRHIEKLHKEQFGANPINITFQVYRGQGLSKEDFNQLMNTKGGLMSFNNLLSTSKDRNISLPFARNALADPDSVGILFVMTIDPSKSTTPFALINGISYFPEEDEVLFSMHTVFRINDIKAMGESQRLFQANLTLTGENDNDLRVLTDHIREESFSDAEGWYRLGGALLKMGQSATAQQVYEVLLDEARDDREKSPIYHQIGVVKERQGEYEEAIAYFEKSLNIDKKILPPNHLNLAASYYQIASVYDDKKEYSKALSYYEKALEIEQQSLPLNHPSLAKSYNNIGVVYKNMNEYSKALSYYEKALEIKQQSLPSNHPSLASSYGNIGNVYSSMSEYSKALSFYEKTLEIQKQSLPLNHPDLGISYNNIGMIYFNIGDYAKAHSFYERAVDHAQRTLPATHPVLRQRQKNLEIVKKKL